jgi:hypothetical protein
MSKRILVVEDPTGLVARLSACWSLPTTKDAEQYFGLALDAVYSVRDVLSRLRERPRSRKHGNFRTS